MSRLAGNRTALRRAAAILAIGAVMLRALIPLGCMPGNLFAGEFMVLCPSGAASQLFAETHGHHGPDDATVDADSACPIGDTLKHAALPIASETFSAPLVPELAPILEHDTMATLDLIAFFRPRAPPVRHT